MYQRLARGDRESRGQCHLKAKTTKFGDDPANPRDLTDAELVGRFDKMALEGLIGHHPPRVEEGSEYLDLGLAHGRHDVLLCPRGLFGRDSEFVNGPTKRFKYESAIDHRGSGHVETHQLQRIH